MTAPASAYVPIAVTSRSGFDESVHFGAAVVVDVSGAVVWSVSDPNVEVYPRSSTKPLQADTMVRLGVELTSEQLALACASHDGTPRHIEVVRSTLAAAGLDESALGNTPGLPLDVASAEALLAAGGHRAPITMNCSGKHAAMLATCLRCGWSLDDYLAFGHPLQLAITERVAELAGRVAHIGVDGCGAPAHVMPLSGLARAFAVLAHERGPVWSAMTQHPELVGGEGTETTAIMRAVPSLMAKAGAEGVFAAALPDGVAVAIKTSDGASRAASVVLPAVLRAVGVDVAADAIVEPILGHGRPVGEVRSLVGR